MSLLNNIEKWTGKFFNKYNKILYEDNSGWNSDTLTLDGIGRYSVLLVYPYPTLSPILCYRVGDYFAGAGVIQGMSDSTTHSTYQTKFAVNDSTDVITWWYSNVLNHPQSSAHTVITKVGIRKIVGLLPEKVLGGS